jgi:hypothetical protein
VAVVVVVVVIVIVIVAVAVAVTVVVVVVVAVSGPLLFDEKIMLSELLCWLLRKRKGNPIHECRNTIAGCTYR